MGPREEDLVKVRDEGELRAGMTVWVRACVFCGRQHCYVLVCPAHGIASGPGFITSHVAGWRVAPGPVHGGEWTYFKKAVDEGRVYRLRDLDTPQETTRERERERVE